MMQTAFLVLAIIFVSAPVSAGQHPRSHQHYYQGYNRQDIYRYGPPENGGYRGGYYGGHYHDNTYYDD